jgi:hypothetical protein
MHDSRGASLQVGDRVLVERRNHGAITASRSELLQRDNQGSNARSGEPDDDEPYCEACGNTGWVFCSDGFGIECGECNS